MHYIIINHHGDTQFREVSFLCYIIATCNTSCKLIFFVNDLTSAYVSKIIDCKYAGIASCSGNVHEFYNSISLSVVTHERIQERVLCDRCTAHSV